MIVYELRHVFFWHEGKPVLSEKLLGFFTSMKTLKDAKKFYCTLPGFCDSQDGFLIRRIELPEVPRDHTVYVASISGWEPDMETFEYEIELGFFATKTDARKAMDTFIEDNPQYMACPMLEFWPNPSEFALDEKCTWTSGFDVYSWHEE